MWCLLLVGQNKRKTPLFFTFNSTHCYARKGKRGSFVHKSFWEGWIWKRFINPLLGHPDTQIRQPKSLPFPVILIVMIFKKMADSVTSAIISWRVYRSYKKLSFTHPTRRHIFLPIRQIKDTKRLFSSRRLKDVLRYVLCRWVENAQTNENAQTSRPPLTTSKINNNLSAVARGVRSLRLVVHCAYIHGHFCIA